MPRKPKKYHYIYKTTNILTNKFYIGMHSTDDLNDGYMGSGKRIKYSIRKYGKENHLVEIMEILSDQKTLIDREIELVNECLLHDPLCLNLKLGGVGGNSAFTEETKLRMKINNSGKNNPMFGRSREKATFETKQRMSHGRSKNNKTFILTSPNGETYSAERRFGLVELCNELGFSCINPFYKNVPETGKIIKQGVAKNWSVRIIQ
jgi:hypothetical protein